MKNIPRLGSLLVLAVSTFSILSAHPDDPMPPGQAPHAPGGGFERHVIIRHVDDDLEKGPVTFLGVETMPVSPTLTAQLNLPKGNGLVVLHVVPDSPALSVLQVHDILLKIDDQVLIEPRQFAVLVRNHQDGDTVTLSYVRGGKPATATVKLVKKELHKMAMMHHHAMGADAAGLDHAGPMSREDMDEMLGAMDGGPAGAETARIVINPGDQNVGYHAMRMNPADSDILYNDDSGSLELSIKNGQKNLVAKNKKGEQVFSGPVTTEENRKAMPADVRARLERIEDMQEFSFQTDENFHDSVQVSEPERTKIRFRVQSSGPGVPPSESL